MERKLCNRCNERPVTKKDRNTYRNVCSWCYTHKIPPTRPYRNATLAMPERFWTKVHKTDGCWIWTASQNADGYGAFVFNGQRGAHRVSWLLHHGEGCSLGVLHTCDNRLCVNPSHLYAGTSEDNMRDMLERGKIVQGKRLATLTVKDVQMIRIMAKLGWPRAFIARQFPVGEQAIRWCIDRKAWRDVPDYEANV